MINIYHMENFGRIKAALAAQKLKFSIKDFFSKCDQIHGKLRIWSHLLKESLMKNFSFCAVPLNIFHILQRNTFSLLIVIISAAFNGNKDIKMGHCIFDTI